MVEVWYQIVCGGPDGFVVARLPDLAAAEELRRRLGYGEGYCTVRVTREVLVDGNPPSEADAAPGVPAGTPSDPGRKEGP